MYYVITRAGVKSAPSLKILNKKMNAKFDISEFVIKGPDFVIELDPNMQSMDMSDLEFVQDKAKMESLCFAGFFKKDNSAKLLCLLNTILTFIILVTMNGCGGN